MCLPQIQLSLDSSSRLVDQLAGTIEFVDALTFGGDQQGLDLVVQFGQLAVAILPVASILNMPQAFSVDRSDRPYELIR